MITSIIKARRRVLGACLVAWYPLVAMSAAAADSAKASTPQGCESGPMDDPGRMAGPGHMRGGPGRMGPAPGPFGERFGGPGDPGPFAAEFEFRPPPYLRDVRLTDDQQDKVFAIVHAAAPGMRDAAKAARKTHEALRDAGSSPQYDASAVAALVQAQTKADGHMMLMRIKAEHDIYSILTPDQRDKVAELNKEHEARAHDEPLR